MSGTDGGGANYGVDQLIDPYRTNDWERLINKTQLLLIPFHEIRYGEVDVGRRDGSVVLRRWIEGSHRESRTWVAETLWEKLSPSNYGPYQSCRIDNDDCILERSYGNGIVNAKKLTKLLIRRCAAVDILEKC